MTTARILVPTLALGLALVAAACGALPSATAGPATADPAAASGATTPAASVAASLSPTPGSSAVAGCTAPAAPTLAQTEGPYYMAGAPQDGELATDAMAGTRLTYTGLVVDATCAPVSGARVETWQADSAGVYDNAGYTLRGWVLTGADGRFTIQTIVPGEYPGRTEHIHVKVTPPGGTTLTTQMYFPGTPVNDSDGIYDPSLELAITQDGDALVGEFTFVIGS